LEVVDGFEGVFGPARYLAQDFLFFEAFVNEVYGPVVLFVADYAADALVYAPNGFANVPLVAVH
jgi:hypothetical protein